MCPMDSSFEESMKEHVFTMTTSAFSASGITCMPAWCRWPIMISLSTRFFAQPREMRLTLIMWDCGANGAQPTRRRPKNKNGGQKDRRDRSREPTRALLLFGGDFGARLLAFEIGGAAFAFDV